MSMQIGTKRPVNDINVTPLIDVVLVLLIIFMVLTPLAEKQMFSRVPEYTPEAVPVPPDLVPPDQTVLTALSSGQVLLNKQQMAMEQAMPLLEQAFKDRPSKVLFFNAEDGAKYGMAVRVLDLARQAGVNTSGMMTDPPMVQSEPAPGTAPGEQPGPGAPAAPGTAPAQ
ncbi:MAG TPA: biopolymer transporter ExbD [Anaeromyxobacteraceae bacterium]